MEVYTMHAGAQILLRDSSKFELPDDNLVPAHNHLFFVEDNSTAVNAAKAEISANRFATVAGSRFWVQYGRLGTQIRVVVVDDGPEDRWTKQRARLLAIFKKHRCEIITPPVTITSGARSSTKVFGQKRFAPNMLSQINVVPLKIMDCIKKDSAAGIECLAMRTGKSSKKITDLDVYLYLKLETVGRCRVTLEMIEKTIQEDYCRLPTLAKALIDLFREVRNWRIGSKIDKCVMRVPFIFGMPKTKGHLLERMEIYPTSEVYWVKIIDKKSEDLFYKTGTRSEPELDDYDSYLSRLRQAIEPYLERFIDPQNYEIEFQRSDKLQIKIEALLSSTNDFLGRKLMKILRLLKIAVKTEKKLLITEHVLQNLHQMLLRLLTQSKKFCFVNFAADALVKAVEEHFNREWPSHVAKSEDSEILIEVFSIVEAMLKLSVWIHFGKVRNLGCECQHALVIVSMHW